MKKPNVPKNFTPHPGRANIPTNVEKEDVEKAVFGMILGVIGGLALGALLDHFFGERK